MKESKSGIEAREDATTSTWSLATQGTIHMDAAKLIFFQAKDVTLISISILYQSQVNTRMYRLRPVIYLYKLGAY